MRFEREKQVVDMFSVVTGKCVARIRHSRGIVPVATDGRGETRGQYSMANWRHRNLTLGRFRPFLPVLVGVAVAGSVAALILHTLAIFATPLWGLLSIALTPGVFVVWFAAILEMQRLNRDPSGKPLFGLDWSRALRGVPRSICIVAGCVAAYVALTSAWALLRGPDAGESGRAAGGLPLWISIVPLTFYLVASLTLISGMRVPPESEEREAA